MSIVTLTTDFGLRDAYVGAMKGVILSIAPAATLVDLSHDIAPQSIAEAAFIVYSAYRYFPPDTVHLVVVDPGVGTARRPLALRTRRGLFVAPDNGVLGYVLDREPEWTAAHLREERFWLRETSHTFHGRDIFAPVAAHLAAGAPLEALGPQVYDPVQRPFPRLIRCGERRVQAQVVYVDRFGNAITNLAGEEQIAGRPAAQWRGHLTARLAAGTVAGIQTTYGEAAAGAFLLLVGSSGFVEIACREGHAAGALGIRIGDPVHFEVESQPAIGGIESHPTDR